MQRAQCDHWTGVMPFTRVFCYTHPPSSATGDVTSITVDTSLTCAASRHVAEVAELGGAGGVGGVAADGQAEVDGGGQGRREVDCADQRPRRAVGAAVGADRVADA